MGSGATRHPASTDALLRHRQGTGASTVTPTSGGTWLGRRPPCLPRRAHGVQRRQGRPDRRV